LKRLLNISLLLLAFCSPQNSGRDYDFIRTKIEIRRQSFQQAYAQADSTGQDSLLKMARDYIFSEVVDEMFPQWFGTPWDFNGTTTVPKQGMIACGYFVTTVIQHSGFKIPRVKWAQMASESMIRKITKDIKRFHNAPVSDVISYLKKKPDGLYIAGMDSHVGFVYKKGNVMRFVHSNYYEAEIGVMSQELAGNNPLNDSHYRVIGRLFDDEMMRKWIVEESWD
jgi:hypothetical protein